MRKFFVLVVLLWVLFVAECCSYGEYPSGKLIGAIALQESGNNSQAVGDKKIADHAYGNLQIRQPALDDVNRKFGTHYKAVECLGNPTLSKWICKEYINMYATAKSIGHMPTDEDKSRIWNGGPKGYKNSATIKYWISVRKLLRRL